MAVHRGRRLDRAFEAARPGPEDRAWIQELTYGVCRLRGRLDHLLGRHLERGPESLPPDVRTILRMGAYQGLYMGGVPTYAAVSESVDAVRRARGKTLAGLTNAVLRRVIADGVSEKHFPDPTVDLPGFLATWGSHPDWLIRRWLLRVPPTVVRAWVAHHNEVPAVCVRPFRMTVREAAERLRASGIRIGSTGPQDQCFELPRGADVPAALELIDGFVQDPAAAEIADFADPGSPTTVADLCAAPGGKALALASIGHTVLAADPSEGRLRRLRANADRLGAPLRILRARAEAPPLRRVDAVLLDVPCSGTGTLSRHPDARWRLTPEKLAALVDLQARLLDGAAEVVAVDGLLVYATCSLEPEENEEQVHRFLARHAGFSLDATATASDGERQEAGMLWLTPDRTGYDGAFAARLRRVR